MQQYQNILVPIIGMSMCWYSAASKVSGPSCFNCVDVKSPPECRQKTNCLPTQICYTHKYTSSGITSFDLGCQSKQVCRIAGSRPSLIGRRNEPAHTLCYSCCNGSNCNNILCVPHPSTTTSTPPTTTTQTTYMTTTTPRTTSTTVMPTTYTSTTTPTTTITPSPTTTTTTSTSTTTPTTTTNSTTTKPPPACPRGYTGFESSCYIIVYKSVHWDSAQSHCHSLGTWAYLVSINSQAEQSFIETLLKDFPVGEIWLGGYIHPFYRRWMWDDGSEVSYKHWDSVFPVNDKSRDKMTMVNPKVNNIFSGYYWKDTYNNRYWAFICEVKV